MTRRSIWFDPWAAPMEMAATARAFAETAIGAQAVIAKRTPMIFEAFTSPWTANLSELALMVSEKSVAFQASAQTATVRGKALNKAMNSQAAALGRLGGGGWLTPMDWWGIAERNLEVCTALMALPGEMLAPYHKGVTVNAKRLKAT